MELDVVFQGIVAPLRLSGAEAALLVLEGVVVGWPYRKCSVDPQAEPFFSVTAESGSDLLKCESHIEGKLPRRFDALNSVCDAMVALAFALPAESPNLICLHAAAVEMAGRLVVFPNVRKAGKSTLAAALACAGHPLFSDDVVPLSFASDKTARGHAMGLAPRLRLPLPDVLPQEFRDWVDAVGGPRNRQYLYLSLPIQPPHGTTLPVGAFVILDRHETPVEARLDPMTPDVVMDALLHQNFTRDRHSGDILQVIAATLAGRPVFRLSYHDLAEAVLCLERQFAHWSDPEPDDQALPDRIFRPADFLRRSCHGSLANRSLQQRTGTTEVWLGDRLYLADVEGRAIHRMDAVGAAVWLALEEPTTRQEVADLLAEAFPETARDRIDADLGRLLQEFDQAGLIEPVPGA